VSRPEPRKLVDYVRSGYARGWSFVPLVGKVPTQKGWASRKRETLDEALAWAKVGNVGLRTGEHSGVLVIDVDPGAAPIELPRTVTVSTPRGGRHYYFRNPTDTVLGNSAGKLGEHIDVRANGGQVVFAGSLGYEWVVSPDDCELAELPDGVLRRLLSPPRTGAYGRTALDREALAVRAAPVGKRNDTLNLAAFRIGQLVEQGDLEYQVAFDALMQAANAAELPAKQSESTIRSGLRGGQHKPRLKSRENGNYVLVPGPHTDDHGNYHEIGTHMFSEAVLANFPADLLCRRDGEVGQVIGADGQASAFTVVSRDRMRIITDGLVKLTK